MNTLLKEIEQNPIYNFVLNEIKNKKSPVQLSGLCAVSEGFFIASIFENLKRPILLVTYNDIQAQKLVSDIKFFTDKVFFLPKKEILTYDYIAESKDLPYERINILNKIFKNQNIIIVTSIETIKQKMIPKNVLYKNILSFKVGDICNVEDIKQKLVALGYERFELIDGRGEFSLRGGIIDISISDTTGVRIELWGDEIDSIRSFNIISQRSIEEIKSTEIFPAHEYILDSNFDDVIKNIKEKIVPEYALRIQEKDIEQIASGDYLSKINKYFNEFYQEQSTILDYISDKYVVCIDDEKKIMARSDALEQDLNNTIRELKEKEKIVPGALENYLTSSDVENNIKSKQVVCIDRLDTNLMKNNQKISFEFKELNYFKAGMELFIKDIKKFQTEQKKVYIMVETKEKAEKIAKILEENEIFYIIQEKLNQTIITKNSKTVIITVGNISAGCYSKDFNQVLINANDLVDATRKAKRYKNETFKQAEKVVFADLKIGDYVVHRKYGIGIYIGVNTITA